MISGRLVLHEAPVDEAHQACQCGPLVMWFTVSPGPLCGVTLRYAGGRISYVKPMFVAESRPPWGEGDGRAGHSPGAQPCTDATWGHKIVVLVDCRNPYDMQPQTGLRFPSKPVCGANRFPGVSQ